MRRKVSYGLQVGKLFILCFFFLFKNLNVCIIRFERELCI